MWLRERKINEMNFCHISTGSREEDNDNRMESTTDERKEIQSEFTQESEEDEDINITEDKLSFASSKTSGKSFPPKLEVYQERKMKKNMTQRRKATVMVTSGALTFILLAATLVTATFLMSPVIEQIFSKYCTSLVDDVPTILSLYLHISVVQNLNSTLINITEMEIGTDFTEEKHDQEGRVEHFHIGRKRKGMKTLFVWRGKN